MHIYIKEKKHFSYFVLNCVQFRPTVSEEKMFNSFYTNEIHVVNCVYAYYKVTHYTNTYKLISKEVAAELQSLLI